MGGGVIRKCGDEEKVYYQIVGVCLLRLPIGQVPISSPALGVGRNQVKWFKTCLPSSCPKFPSEGTVAVAGVMTHCTEKKPLFFCSTSMWGLSLLAGKSAILKSSPHFPIHLYQ